MLRDEEMIFKTSDLTRIQGYSLEKLQEKPGWEDNPKTKRKIKKMNEKRICIFYHLSESAAKEVPVIRQNWSGSGTEGTKQP